MTRSFSFRSTAGLFITLVVTAATGAALVGSEFDPRRFVAGAAYESLGNIHSTWTIDPWFVRGLLWACGETAAVAVLGLILALWLGRVGRWADHAVSPGKESAGRDGFGRGLLSALLHAARSVVAALPPVLWTLLFVHLLRLGSSAAVLGIGVGWGAVVSRSTTISPLRWLSGAIATSAAAGFAGAGGLGLLLRRAIENQSGGELMATLAALTVLMALGAMASRVAIRKPSGSTRITILSAVAFVVAAQSLAPQLRELLSTESLHLMLEIPARLWPPERSAVVILDARQGLVETLSMSVVATVLGALLAAALARVKSTPSREPAAAHLTTAYTLGFALVLVAVLGLGPFAGAVAVTAQSTGFMLARVGRESKASDFLRHAIDAWCANLRIATVVGIVGAGGVGFYASYALGTFNGHALSTHLMVAVLLAFLVDAVAAEMHRRFTTA